MYLFSSVSHWPGLPRTFLLHPSACKGETNPRRPPQHRTRLTQGDLPKPRPRLIKDDLQQSTHRETYPRRFSLAIFNGEICNIKDSINKDYSIKLENCQYKNVYKRNIIKSKKNQDNKKKNIELYYYYHHQYCTNHIMIVFPFKSRTTTETFPKMVKEQRSEFLKSNINLCSLFSQFFSILFLPQF